MDKEKEIIEKTEDKAEYKTTGKNLVAVVGGFHPGVDITDENVEQYAVTTIDKLSGIQDKLMETAEEYPDFAAFLSDVLKGMSPDEAIARNFDETVMTPPEGAPDWDKINSGKDHRRSMIAEKQSKIDQLSKNQEITTDNAVAFIEETGLEETVAKEFLDWYDGLHKDMFDGLVSKDHLSALYKAWTHDKVVEGKDKEVKDAKEEGMIAGKNAKIEKQMVEADTGDSIPKLSGGAETPKKKTGSYGANFFEGVV